jgi:hypothetical protein
MNGRRASLFKSLVISDSIKPGQTAFTHIPLPPNSFASALVMPITPPVKYGRILMVYLLKNWLQLTNKDRLSQEQIHAMK